MRTISLQDLDPMRVDVSEEVMAKYQHHFAEGDRVRIKENGRCGKLEALHGHSSNHVSGGDRCVVLMDSGHRVQLLRDEIEPFDWHTSDEPAPAKANMMTPVQFDALQRKLSLGELDEWDSYVAKKAFSTLVVTGLDDGPETESDRELAALCKKYLGESAGAGGDAGSSFAKAAGSNPRFQVGDRVRDDWGNLGKITAINAGRAEIRYDSGVEGSVLIGRFKAA